MGSRSRNDVGPLSRALAEILSDTFVLTGGSQEALGEMSGISQSQLSRYLRGERVLTVEELEALCEALGLDLVHVVREGKRRAVDFG